MADDPWITSRETEMHAAPILDLGAEQPEVRIREHPSIAGMLWLDWDLGARTLLSLNGTSEQLRGLLQRSLDALDAHEQAQAGESGQ